MTSHRQRWTRGLAMLAASAVVAGLGVLGIALPAQAAVQDGTYQGKTSDGFDISITVSGGSVTDVNTQAWTFCGVPPLPFQTQFIGIPTTPIGADGSFSAHWTYAVDAQITNEYWLGGTVNANGTITSSGSNAADVVGPGMQCTGTQFTYTAEANPQPAVLEITPNPATVSQIRDPQGAVTLLGTGFAPSTSVQVLLEGSVVGTVTTGTDGSVSIPFRIGDAVAGSYLIGLRGGGETAERTLVVIDDPVVTPTVAVDPSTVTVSQLGTTGAAVSGTGFPASSPATVSLDGTQVATTTTDAAGALSSSVVRAGVAPGAHTVTVTSGSATASATLTVNADPVQYDPKAAVSPGTLTVSDLAATGVTISGTGFPENAPISISVDGAVVSTPNTDASGAVSFVHTASGAATGSHPVVLTSGQWSANASFTVTADPVQYHPAVAASPKSLTVSALGSTGVTATGTGFPENAPIEVLFDGQPIGSATTDASGAVSAPVVRAGASVGRHTVLLRSGAWEASDTITVTEDPVVPGDVVLSPSEIATGALGSQGVTVSATGLPAGTPVRIEFRDAIVARFMSGLDGSGSADFSVQGVPPGTYTVRLVQTDRFLRAAEADALPAAVGDVLGEAELTVTEDPQTGATITLASGSIGSDVLGGAGLPIGGAGFTPGQTVQVLLDGQVVGEVVADADGRVVHTLKVTGVAPGAHEVTLAQGDLSASTTLTVLPVVDPGTPGNPGTPGTPGSGTPGGQNGGGQGTGLAATGLDGGAAAAMAAIATALVAAGGLLVLRRRASHRA